MAGHLITHVSIGIEEAVWQIGKGTDALFEYDCLYLQVNQIVEHSNFLMYDWKRSQSVKLPWKKSDWQRKKDSFGSIYWIGKKYVSFINQHSRVSV